jgi:TolB-like protein
MDMRHATHIMRSFQSSGFCRLAAVSAMVLAPAALALADPAPPAVPQSQPAATPPELVQAVPVETAPAQPAQPAKIVVLPFELVGGKPGDTWLARSIQQSVLTDLLTASRSQVVTSVAPAADTAGAADLGHKLGTRYVVFGQVHINENALRVTGQIVSTATDSVVGTLKATGTLNDLFTLEDVLGNETRGAVGRLEGPQFASAVPPQQPPPTIQQVVPYPQDTGVPYPGVYDTSPVYPVPYDSGYPYDYYPDTNYPYFPYFYGGIGFGRGIGGHGIGDRGIGGRGIGGRGIGGRGIGGGAHGGGGRVGGGHGGGHR